MLNIFKDRVESPLDQKAPRTMALGGGIQSVFKDSKGLLHRKDEPAVIFDNGLEIYYWHGWLHRLDGFAKVDEFGNGQYYIEGRFIDNESEFKRLTRLWKLKNMGF